MSLTEWVRGNLRHVYPIPFLENRRRLEEDGEERARVGTGPGDPKLTKEREQVIQLGYGDHPVRF